MKRGYANARAVNPMFDTSYICRMRKLNRCVREFPTRQLAASIDVLASARIPLTAILEQKPCAPLGHTGRR